MENVICPGCKRSVAPRQRYEKDKKHKKTWCISYCPFDRCNFNIEIDQVTTKVWNAMGQYFEDYVPNDVA